MEPRPPHYALVAYVRNSLGQFVEGMRQQLHPDHTHSPAHITILPPRPLCGSEVDAVETLHRVLSQSEAFEVKLGEVETFYPITPTVFIRVEQAAHRIRDLHDQLNLGPMCFSEQWPFMPHLTIVKMAELSQTEAAFRRSRAEWQQFAGSRRARILELTFVREVNPEQWADVATIRLREPLAT